MLKLKWHWIKNKLSNQNMRALGVVLRHKKSFCKINKKNFPVIAYINECRVWVTVSSDWLYIVSIPGASCYFIERWDLFILLLSPPCIHTPAASSKHRAQLGSHEFHPSHFWMENSSSSLFVSLFDVTQRLHWNKRDRLKEIWKQAQGFSGAYEILNLYPIHSAPSRCLHCDSAQGCFAFYWLLILHEITI